MSQAAELKRYHAERQRISRAENPYGEGSYQSALFMALQIWDEYMSQIGRCVSQDYARLADFPNVCAKLGVRLAPRRDSGG